MSERTASVVFRDPSRTVAERVDDLLARMTLDEKVAQLSSVWLNQSPLDYARFAAGAEHLELDRRIPDGIGGLTRPLGSGPLPLAAAARVVDDIQRWLVEHTRLGIPALVHEECLTGLMAPGCTVMPAPLNWGATFDPDLIAEMASAIRSQLVAAGVHQGLAPVLDVVRDQRYGRVEECIGEDAYLVAVVGAAYVAGLQGPVDQLVATAKHFVGHAAAEAGRNTAPVHVGPRELRDVHLLPFELAVQVGVGAVMTAYHDIDGVPATIDRPLVTGVLRDEWGFDGIVVSDYWGLDFLHEQHHVAGDQAAAATLALDAGVDFELPNPRCYPRLAEAVRDGRVDVAAVDLAVRRVLATKVRLGLFERFAAPACPTLEPHDDASVTTSIARRVADASVTLLTNPEGILPLARGVRRLAVIGPNATSSDALCGNYSYVNHVAYLFPEAAVVRPLTAGDAIAARAAGVGIAVRQATGCDAIDAVVDEHALADAVATAHWADVAVVVLGDRAGHLGRGTVGEGSDADDLGLPGGQGALLGAVVETGTPVVLVHVAGRAHDLSWAADHVGAILACWFPGDEGGPAIAAALFGDTNPAGRCSVTFSRGAGQQPAYYDHRLLSAQDYGPRSSSQPVFPFGHGLSYTAFAYDDLAVDASARTDGALRVACTVRNTGTRQGDEVVQLYVRDVVASVVRPVRQLRGFHRVALEPGRAARVEFEVPTDLLAFAGRDGDRIIEPGTIEIEIGASSADLRLRASTELVGDVRRMPRQPRLRHRSTAVLLSD